MSFHSRLAWISASLALFLVLVLPACVGGQLERQFAMGALAPYTFALDEERDEHEIEAVNEGAAERCEPRPAGEPRVVEVTHERHVPFVGTSRGSVTWPRHPALFSERLLM